VHAVVAAAASAACDVGEMCGSKWDCKTSNCSSGTCQQLPTCTNKVLDPTEGDVDCGQLCARQCGVTSTCRLHGDCISGVCTAAGVPARPPAQTAEGTAWKQVGLQ